MGCPIRLIMGVMICYTAVVNYTVLGNMSLSITAMVSGKSSGKPSDCVGETASNSTTEKPDYGPRYSWDENTQGHILGSFFYGFIFTSFPAGLIAEWLGPYNTILWTNVIMAICNYACVPSAGVHYLLLCLNRFIIGAAAGLIYPALQCLIARWAPPQEKGKFVAALLGNNLGTCLVWYTVGAITEHAGWNWGFYAITINMLVFCVVFGLLVSDNPDSHRWISQEELTYILESQGGTVSKKRAVPPYKAILTSGAFWTMAILHFGNLWGLYLQMTGVPKFLNQAIGFSVKESGAVSALPQLVRVFLGFTYGIIGDYMKRKQFTIKFIRKFFCIFSHIIPGVAMAAISLVGCNKVAVASLLTASQAINGAAVLTNLANPQDLAPNFAGTLFGILTLICGTTGFITPQITAALTKDRAGTKEYGIAFLIAGGMYVGCGIVFMFIGSTDLQPWNEKKEDDS